MVPTHSEVQYRIQCGSGALSTVALEASGNSTLEIGLPTHHEHLRWEQGEPL